MGLPLDEHKARLQAQTYQYQLHIQTLSSEQEKFKLKLSRQEKGSDGFFERLHTATIRQGKLRSSSSNVQEAQDDTLLNLFNSAAVHRFGTNSDTICYSWADWGHGDFKGSP